MKLIIGVIVSLAILELFQCTPLIGNEDGSYKETNSSSSWGFHAGVEAGLGLEAGWKDGHGVLGTKTHLSSNIGGHKENSQKDTYHTFAPVPTPNNYGPGLTYNPGNGLPYYNPYYQQFPLQFPPQAGQQLVYVPQPIQQYPQWSQYGPQYALPAGPQFAQQPTGPQFAQQPTGPQFAQQPAGSQFAQQPTSPQFAQQAADPGFAQQPAGPQFAQQPAGRQFGQQPTAYIQQWPQFTQQRLLPATSIPQRDGGPTKSP